MERKEVGNSAFFKLPGDDFFMTRPSVNGIPTTAIPG
jgi:hypothetical protein